VAGNGTVLVEVYDASTNQPLATSTRLVNISTRGFVEPGDGALIAGFAVTGNTPKRVLIRGIGPGIAQFLNGAATLADPSVKVQALGSTAVIAENNDWSTPMSANAATAAEIAAASASAGAFPLTAGSRDAAIVVTLAPGSYTAVVTGAGTTTGGALVEVYELSNQ
jgi:hypothetical protein